MLVSWSEKFRSEVAGAYLDVLFVKFCVPHEVFCYDILFVKLGTPCYCLVLHVIIVIIDLIIHSRILSNIYIYIYTYTVACV
jgi:hypothetical protein